ncbi:MAG TPA: acriflavin resistance protein [Verrucomicrobiales bacterium]|nr:acriflavin resistance protein [Verrucomicrobiales bacterium]
MPDQSDRPSTDNAERVTGALTRFSLERRVTMLMLFVTILVVGFIATLGIPLELVPKGFTGQSLFVSVPWPNAPAEEVMEKITLPLEEELSTVRGLDQINSYSSSSGGRAFIRFKQGTDMQIAYREVRDRLQRAKALFPEDVERTYIFKEDSSGIPVAAVGLAIDPSLTDYYTLVNKEVIERLQRIDGVAKVEANGLEEKAIIIELDKRLADAHGLNIYELAQDLGGDNFTLASGDVRDGGKEMLLRSVATYKSLEEIENRRLTPSTRLRDVARIKYEEEEKRYSVRVNSRPAVAAIVFKEGEANTVEVSRAVRAAVDEMRLNPRLSNIYIEGLFNQGEVVEESIDSLVRSGQIGGMLAALVLFTFLRRFRLTAIITLSIPLSIVISLIVIYFAGESLNLLTMLGLMICVGMVVDNSVVVAENIHRFHKDGLPRREACIHGAAEIALAITLSTLTTVIVFLPAALVEGQGQFFLVRLALPICVALLASLMVALVFVPLAVYLTLPPSNGSRQPGAWQRFHLRLNEVLRGWYEATFGRLNRGYVSMLGWSLKRRLDLVLLLSLVFTATTMIAFKKIEFVESQEEDQTSFEIDVDSSNEYSFEDMREYFAACEKVIEERQDEFGLRGYFIFFRSRGGNIQGWFDEDAERTESAKATAEKLLAALPRKPGIKLRYGRENQGEEAKGKDVYVMRLEGDDPVLLEDIAEALEPQILAVAGVIGIRAQEENSPNEVGLIVDRDRANASQVNPQVIAGMVGYALRGTALPRYSDNGREIPVRIRFREEDRTSLNDLDNFWVPTANEEVVPVSALTSTRMLNNPRSIFRNNKRISRTITIELSKETAKETRERIAGLQRQLDLPEGISFGQSQFTSVNEELQNLIFAASVSVLFIYLLMGFLFESFILPLSIILTIPLAAVGVGWAHYFSGLDMDFLGVVGGILLVGVVVNNGIVLIDYVNRLRADGHDRAEALLTAANRRFRPILMTAMTTIFGMIPLTISKPSEIGLSYKSFGITLIGGMSTATLLTLLVVPIFYTLFDDARLAFGRTLKQVLSRGAGSPAAAGDAPAFKA